MASVTEPTRLVHITTVPQSLGFIAGQVDSMKSKGFDVQALSSPGKFLERFAVDHGNSCVHRRDVAPYLAAS